MRRIATALTVLLVLLLILLGAVMLRYDLRSTPVDDGEIVYRLDRWTGEVTVMAPADLEEKIVALSSLAAELQETREAPRGDSGDRGGKIRENAEQVGDDLLWTVLNLREILAGYREEALSSLPTEGSSPPGE